MAPKPSTGWSDDTKVIRKLFTFGSFASALAFMVEVGMFCEKTNHHPEWKNIYNKVWVELSTHDVGKVTDKDRTLAATMDTIASRFQDVSM